MQITLNILVIEDDPDGRQSVTDALAADGHQVSAVENGKLGLVAAAEKQFDVILCDVRLPDMDGLEVLKHICRHLPNPPPVILMTAYGTVATAVAALKTGAYDYILKPLDLMDLQTKAARAGETARLRAEVSRLQTALTTHKDARPFIFKSDSMRKLLQQTQLVASTKATVLITGESGTGKELIARQLHYGGERASESFVAVNCGALPETLLESELFGHEKGAFTGAAHRHAGAFERAQNGTLFLDEIAIAPPAVQERLLRVLEEKEITRVGGSQNIALDVRVIAASNRDLRTLAKENQFRHDLLYRLQVVTLLVPPLRERLEDIRPLTDHFIALACAEHGRQIESIAPDYYAALERYHWPGNVRQLKHAIEASVLMAAKPRLAAENLQLGAISGTASEVCEIPPGLTLKEIEQAALLQALRRHQGHRAAVAEELGITTRTIQRKIQEYNLPF